jgi:L-alanine-DL-glutamate epimerase-like enolase superfamily enzyme
MDYQEDIKRIRAVNSILPEGVTMLLDANQGYSYDQGVEVLQETKDCHKLTIFEQPFNAKAWDDLRRLRVGSRIPIIADESAVTVEDAVQLMEQNYIDGVNIKLMKCGGIINFLKIYKRAKELEKNIMIGCMYESNISITTGAALAFVLQLYAVDLDSGTLDFPDESIKGGAYVENGFIYISKRLSIDI